MKQRAICENHLFQKAYKNGKRASSRSVTVYVLKDRRAALRAEQLVRLHGKVSAILEHVVTFLLLNLVCKPYFIHKVLCHTKKSKNCEKMLAISCILC